LPSGRRGSHLSDGAGLEGDGHGHRVAVYGEDGPRSGGWLGKLGKLCYSANKFMDILAIMIDHNPILTDMFFGFFFLHSHSPSSTIVNSACEFWGNTGYLYVYMYINGDGLKPMIHSILGGGTSHLSQLNFGVNRRV
jgi:hypothetical protein